MWIHNGDFEVPIAIKVRDVPLEHNLITCLRREAQAAQLYLLTRPALPCAEWRDQLADLLADALNHHELLQEIATQLEIAPGAWEQSLPGYQTDADPAVSIGLCMDVEEELLAGYGDIVENAKDNSLRKIAEYLCERKERHIRRLCWMMCAARGLTDPELDGCCEEIEYYTDAKSGKLCCRSKRRTVTP